MISACAFIFVSSFALLPTSAFTIGRCHRTVPIWGTPPAGLQMSTVVEASTNADAVVIYEKNLEKMRAKDKTSKSLSKSDLKIVYEDEHIVVVDKPAGVLCVPNKDNDPSLAGAVFDAYGCESGNVDKMVAQRLGFDTSGLVVFARTDTAVSGLNTALRSRKMTRKYEALLCGSLDEDSGEIDYALTRDAAALPYMRVYSEDSQRALIEVASKEDVPAEVDRLCKNEQPSLTKYEVVGREELGGHPVTRVALTSVSGRTHQLNVHCAAIGHPIVGDSTYGARGDASPNGGMTEEAPGAASTQLQKDLASQGTGLCVHLKELSFKHPVTKEDLSFESSAPF